VATAVRLSSMGGAATFRTARDDATDGAQLHGIRVRWEGERSDFRDAGVQPVDIATSVSGVGESVYSPAVLRLRGQPSRNGTPLPT
jgi:hypothetical protein